MTEIFWTLCYYTLSRQLYGTDDVCGFVHQKAFRQDSRDQARPARQAGDPNSGKLRDVPRHY